MSLRTLWLHAQLVWHGMRPLVLTVSYCGTLYLPTAATSKYPVLRTVDWHWRPLSAISCPSPCTRWLWALALWWAVCTVSPSLSRRSPTFLSCNRHLSSFHLVQLHSPSPGNHHSSRMVSTGWSVVNCASMLVAKDVVWLICLFGSFCSLLVFLGDWNTRFSCEKRKWANKIIDLPFAVTHKRKQSSGP